MTRKLKDTKFLFDEDAMTPEGMVSVSQIQQWLRCPRAWQYGYAEGLTPRVDRPYLTIGKLCHRGFEAAMTLSWLADHAGAENGTFRATFDGMLEAGLTAVRKGWRDHMGAVEFNDEEIPVQEDLLHDAEAVFSQALAEFDPERWEVQTVVRHGEQMPALELHFRVPCAGSKGLHGFIDAVLRDRETGHVWCVDYKFRSQLAPDDEERFNLQNAVYAHACSRMGLDVTGTCTWQHSNKPATQPRVLKDGSVSRAKVRTTWPLYRQFLLDRGLDPDEYDEMKTKLADVEMSRATFEYRNPDTVRAVWREVIVPSAYAIRRAYRDDVRKVPAMFPWNCRGCAFTELCQAELRGYDADWIRESDFVRKGHRQQGN